MPLLGAEKPPSSAELREKVLRCRQWIVKSEEGCRPKTKVACPSALDRVRHSTRGPSTVHYLTTGPAAPKDPPNPYALTELPVRVRSKGYAAPTIRWRDAVSIRERLRVVGEEEEPRKKGRLLPELRRIRPKFVRKKYQEELKKRTLTNILTGYEGDLIKRNEENSITVQFALEQAQNEIDKASKSMAEFLSEEQKNCESLTKKLNEVLEAKKKRENQIETERKKMSEVKLRIFHQNEYMEKMKKCREFVLKVAPEEWKKQYEEETKKRQEEVKDDIFKLKKAMRNYKTNCAGEDPGLEKVLEDFIEEYSNAGPPSLPYDDPQRVFSLFKDLELKSLRALHHNTMLKKAVEKAKALSVTCDNYFQNEKERIDDMLKEVKEGIENEKKNVEEKEFLLQNLKKGPYKNMIASESVLMGHILIQDVYEELIDQPKQGLDILEMLQEIGELYFDLNRRLEKLSLSEKKTLEKQVRNELEKGMREAEKAERRKKQIESMVKGLRRAREKPWVRKGRPLLYRSRPQEAPAQVTRQKEEEKSPGPLVLKNDLETNFPLVYAVNHPGPGPYRKPSPAPDVLTDYKAFYPDLTIVDTDEEAALISESEEEKDGKKKIDPAEEKKKVKRKKPKKIIESDESE